MKTIVLVLCLLFVFFYEGIGQDMEELSGIWRGMYNDYSYTITIDSVGNCRIIQEEVYETSIATKIVCDSGICSLSIQGENYQLLVLSNGLLQIVPYEKGIKDVRVMCLVQLRRVAKGTTHLGE